VVPKPPEVNPIHHLAQLQMANHQGNNFHSSSIHDFDVLLFDSGLHGEEASRSLKAFKLKELISKRGNNINSCKTLLKFVQKLRRKLFILMNMNFAQFFLCCGA
jgi:hypothetical protein